MEVFTEGTHRTLLQETLDTHKAVLEAIKCGDSTWAREALPPPPPPTPPPPQETPPPRRGAPPPPQKWVLQLKELTKPEEPEEKE